MTVHILWYSVLFVLGFAWVSLLSFAFAIRPPKVEIPLAPADVGLEAQEVELTAKDSPRWSFGEAGGVRLSAWYIQGDEARFPKRAIILLHGYPANKADLLPLAAQLSPEFSLLLLDFRYFGKSAGAFTTLGIREVYDIQAVLDFLQGRGYEDIGAMGYSMGGAVALRTAAFDSRTKAVASYAAYADLETLGQEAYARLWILSRPLTSLMAVWGRILFGEWASEASPLKAAEHIAVPVLLVHNKQDEQIAFRHAEMLKHALGNNPRAEFLFAEAGDHNALPPDFAGRIADFFRRSL